MVESGYFRRRILSDRINDLGSVLLFENIEESSSRQIYVPSSSRHWFLSVSTDDDRFVKKKTIKLNKNTESIITDYYTLVITFLINFKVIIQKKKPSYFLFHCFSPLLISHDRKVAPQYRLNNKSDGCCVRCV